MVKTEPSNLKMTTDLSDENLAEKFKRDFNEQFHVLVRMHLSFLLDLATEESAFSDKNKLKKWSLVPFNKKGNKSRSNVEGAPLTQEGICQVYQLIEFLRKEQNIKIEGVFRRTGSLNRQHELRGMLSQGVTLELEGGPFSIHDCASVLKTFLAELPDPLLTEAHYQAYCQIADSCGLKSQTPQNEKLLTALQLLLLLLPGENKVLLKDILDLLHLTTLHVSSNRMSADNLAKLFTPHLLCPRKLPPEQLHANSQTLSGIISFMITNHLEVFKIPQKLIVDFRARYEKRRILTNLNESVVDQFAANTVFTFVDQARTAKENETNTTETALAQLYAHIQSLPESSKKRKLVKQFNKENGHGTPLQVLRVQKSSLGDSIKKHIFHKKTPRAKLFCTSTDASREDEEEEEEVVKRSKVEDIVTSTPCASNFTPENRKSMSPITRSTQRMSRAMQETMMTPRSRKPVLLVSGSTIALPKPELEITLEKLPEENEALTENFKDYLQSRSIITDTEDEEFSSRTDDFNSTDFNDLSPSKMTDSLLECLDGNNPETVCEKEPVLKPKQFDENGQPIVFETSF